MIKALFHKKSSGFTGFEIDGHSGLAESGQDILCAAVSSMSELVINTARDIFGADLAVEVKSETAHLKVKIEDVKLIHERSVDGLFEGFFKELQFISQDYPRNLRVEITQEEK